MVEYRVPIDPLTSNIHGNKYIHSRLIWNSKIHLKLSEGLCNLALEALDIAGINLILSTSKSVEQFKLTT